jgi:hypothetical protein
MTGPVILEKAKSFYDEIKITDSTHSLMAVTKNYFKNLGTV